MKGGGGLSKPGGTAGVITVAGDMKTCYAKLIFCLLNALISDGVYQIVQSATEPSCWIWWYGSLRSICPPLWSHNFALFGHLGLEFVRSDTTPCGLEEESGPWKKGHSPESHEIMTPRSWVSSRFHALRHFFISPITNEKDHRLGIYCTFDFKLLSLNWAGLYLSNHGCFHRTKGCVHY
jgi:hypothetical protein